MDATIAAALISGGVGVLGVAGTAITASIGSRNTRRATEQAIAAGAANTRATLLAAHKGRLWEKESAAYEETLSGLLYRQAKRRHDLRNFRWDDATEEDLKNVFDGYDPPGLFEVQGRLVAYAADTVMDAFEVASRAHGDVRGAYAHWEALMESIRQAQRSGRFEGYPEGDTMRDTKRKVSSALEAADAADDALIKVIRDELRSNPEAAIASAGVPAVHRGFWHRRKAVND